MSTINAYWFLPPLVIACSVVYAATRHEDWRRIWIHAGRLAATILGVLVAVNVVLLLINTRL
jgi:hypothetical protein